MKLSTKGIYALEAVLDLAIHSTDEVESIKNISQRRNISENYLEQLLGKLRKNGIIKSTRGAFGGYSITKDLDSITVREVLEAVEGPLVAVDCLLKECKKNDCEMEQDLCATRSFWSDITDELNKVVENVTIKDLVQKYEKLNRVQEIEYYI